MGSEWEEFRDQLLYLSALPYLNLYDLIGWLAGARIADVSSLVCHDCDRVMRDHRRRVGNVMAADEPQAPRT